MRKSALITVTGLLFAAPFSAMAGTPNYSYMQGLYTVDGSVDLPQNGNGAQTSDLGGFQLKLSLGLSDHIFGRAEYSEISIDKLDNGDYRFFSVGGGAHFSIGSDWYAFDLFGLASFETIQGGDFDYDASGYGLKAGIRWLPTDRIEIAPFYEYFDYGELDKTNTTVDGSRYGVQALFSITDSFAITAVYQANNLELENSKGGGPLEFEDKTSVGIRYYFASGSGSSVF